MNGVSIRPNPNNGNFIITGLDENTQFTIFDFNGKKYSCIRELMNENRFLHINGDNEYFEDTPKDHHPSKQCHRIIADNVIKKIESNDVTYGDMFDKNIEYLEYHTLVDNIYKDYVTYNPETRKLEKNTNNDTNKLI